MQHIVKILEITEVTHDVKSFKFEKPEGYSFVPGQATDVSVNKPGWEDELRPFTFTSLNEHPYLQFTIKRYADHNGVTNQIHQLKAGDELIIRDVWGAIEYKGEGYFIAGGAGITPFLAILRQLKKENHIGNNQLFFCNKTENDIILKDELQGMLGKNAVFTTTNEKSENYEFARIDQKYLKEHIKDFTKRFYICGPDQMVVDINNILSKLGAKSEAV